MNSRGRFFRFAGLPGTGLLLAAAALSGPRAVTADSLTPFADLTDADPITAIVSRTANVDGRLVRYPTPTRELAAALETRAGKPDAPGAAPSREALRHLAEARRELGDLPGAEEALSRWASSSPTGGGAEWDETARWAARHRRWALARNAAAMALDAPLSRDGFGIAARKQLATDRIDWASEEPAAGDPEAFRADRAARFPDDAAFAEEWIRSLEKAKKIRDADRALAETKALPPERRALLAARIRDARGDLAGAVDVLEKAVLSDAGTSSSQDLRKAFSSLLDRGGVRKRDAWRASLDKRFDPAALTLAHADFLGKGRGDLAAELLAQVELRHSAALDRAGWLLLSRLHEATDSIPEAFRSRLAGAQAAQSDLAAQADDLAVLVRLALRAGARPLAWGTYNDEPLKWAARIDVHPGFSTGALSFLMTGFDAKSSLQALEGKRLPERTFRTARLLLDELERRSPSHAAIPGLVVEVMDRHVQQGHGAEAMKLLPKADKGEPPVRAAARRAALLAIRQAKEPIGREAALWKERLRFLAADRSVPVFGSAADGYAAVLREAIARLDGRDRSHRTSLDLLLGELDRLPEAEALWLFGAERIDDWQLDDEMEGRYRAALKSFDGADWWNRLARWYARHQKGSELKALADAVVATFRGTELFRRDPRVSALVQVEGQPELYVVVADYLRLRALERFPASPLVVKEAEARLVTLSKYRSLTGTERAQKKNRGVVTDDLLRTRQNAVLFQDDARRAAVVSDLMRERKLEAFLLGLEKKADQTPVDHLLLLEGWSRLSRFEQAAGWADRLAENYPGDARRATDAVTLHRSLSGLTPAEAEKAARIVQTVLPAVDDPGPLLTQLGEMWEDLDRPAPAATAFRQILAVHPRSAAASLEVATAFWDYGHFEEASKVIAEGRRAVGQPRLHAFEAGVLKEETKDLNGALEEYLSASAPVGEGDENGEADRCGPGDARASRRLARLSARQTPRSILLAKVDALRPGDAPSESMAIRLLAVVGAAEETSDPWDDWVDMPRDPVGREQRAARREASQPAVEKGVVVLGSRLQAKCYALAEKATKGDFLAALRRWRRTLLDPRWTPALKQAEVELESRILARESDLVTTPEARIDAELARARYLASSGRPAEAAKIPPALLSKIDALPDGVAKIRALVTLARFAEEKGDAVEAWSRVSTKYPWSLGVLDDHLEFLFRTGKTRDALDLLERRVSSAAAGHKERLADRLVAESLDRGDVPRAKRALALRLTLPLEPEDRVAAAGQLARVSFREEPAFDAVALGKREAKLLPDRLQPDLWNALAVAARREEKPKADLTLSLEALNRRLERDWLAGAAKAAAAAGLDGEMLRFFEAQRTRSPRDVRWAVAVRDLQMYAANLGPAVEAAREACAIAPDHEGLQREAVSLYERAGRFRDASDFLSTWAKSRAGDESVALWRAQLLVRAGENTRAVELVRTYLAAAPATAGDEPEDEEGGKETRFVRAVRRFLEWNRPRAAWMLAFPPDGKAAVRGAALPHGLQAELALRAGRFDTLFERMGRNEAFLTAAASPVSRLARPEQLASLQETLLARLFPAGKPPDQEALNRFWAFSQNAGLHRFPEAVARKLFERGGAGPWGAVAPVEFVRESRAVEPVPNQPRRLAFAPLPSEREWVQFLVRRDRTDLLVPTLDRMVGEMDRQVASAAPVGKVPFAAWFPVEPFARIAVDREPWRLAVRRWFGSRNAWTRFLKATDEKWNVAPLVPLLDPPAREAWIRANRSGGSRADDAVQRVGAAVAALVENAPGAVRSPDVARLRGPRTVGDLLGNDPRWAFADLAPAGSPGKEADTGRAPEALWGHRPGEAWYVLETLSRLREKDPLAPYVPLDAAARGQEAARGLLASRTAQAVGDLPLALQLDGGADALLRLDRLERRLRLLVASPAGAKGASDLFGKEVASRQRTIDDVAFRELERLGLDLGLGAAADRIDAGKPVSSALAAYLVDRYGPSRHASLVAVDPAQYRYALGWRWRSDLDSLSGERLAYALDTLWTEGAIPFPSSAVVRTKLFWPETAGWLSLLDVSKRKEGLAAARALPDAAGVSAVTASLSPEAAASGEALQLLLLRADVAGGRGSAALDRLGSLLAPKSPSSRPAAAPAPVAPAVSEGSDEEGEPSPAPAADRPEASSPIRAALRIVRLSKEPKEVAGAEALIAAKLRKGEIPGNLVQLRLLAVDLATTREALDKVLQQLERDWAGGDWQFGPDRLALASLLAPRDEAAASRWLARLEEPRNLDEVRSRASFLLRLKKPELARGEWIDSLRLPLTRPEELTAFDGWRQLGPGLPEPPASWKAAVVFWRKKGADFASWSPELSAHLARVPYDRLAARSVLRSLSPASEEAVAPAVAALGSQQDVSSWRIVRATAPRSLIGASSFLPGPAVSTAELRKRRFPRAEIDGLLRVLARVGAATGKGPLVDQSVQGVEDLGFAPAAPLRAEVAAVKRSLVPPPSVVQARSSAWVYLRPADLGWDLYSRILTSEEAR